MILLTTTRKSFGFTIKIKIHVENTHHLWHCQRLEDFSRAAPSRVADGGDIRPYKNGGMAAYRNP